MMTPTRISELAKVFLKLGIIGFGGPAAHIAMMENEVVNRRNWLTRSHFLDLMGATNLIPGPNSTEMAIHVGYIYGGLPGLVVAGVCFILPAVLISAIFAWIYVQFGTLPQISPLLYGIQPAVLAIISDALWRLGKKAVKTSQLLLIGLGVALLLLFGVNEVVALLLGGVMGMIWLGYKSNNQTTSMIVLGTAQAAIAASTSPVTPTFWQLGWFFLKVGSVLYGSGYVLVAFLQGEMVEKYHWLTQQQLLDAIAIGQFTPGPVLSTATFIGYLILGVPGALVATLAIFLPSFFFVAALNPIIPKLRQWKFAGAFLDAVNVSSVGLMIVVTCKLALAILIQPVAGLPFDLVAIFIAVVATFFLLRFRVNAPWLVLGGGTMGWLSSLFLGNS
ncbi:MAG: chromate efflux transporter [Gomphosphaeria aponina SAG 52.96 = DSM 107014]|uniref:Chromate efflux transporter n=1 Tax=Gomphosphaeria aponina SAG 52.96 = DSM 107014 TaxID=1521640 RepID=A0A941JQP9_9CHRO|nr:chromate efflux transporter [Gomphosphaeria aponina SAG 52.96 = DSM 107014]